MNGRCGRGVMRTDRPASKNDGEKEPRPPPGEAGLGFVCVQSVVGGRGAGVQREGWGGETPGGRGLDRKSGRLSRGQGWDRKSGPILPRPGAGQAKCGARRQE